MARVESSERVTEAGDYMLVITIVPREPAQTYRTGPQGVRLRGLARRPSQAVTWMEGAGELPVLAHLPSPLAVDLRAIVGESDAEAIERAAYRAIGTPQWKPVQAPSSRVTDG